jgi:hypothetical protein
MAFVLQMLNTGCAALLRKPLLKTKAYHPEVAGNPFGWL